jgi:outer membrane biosynthesis protein TonB
MGPSTFISAALHVAVVLFVIVSFPSSRMQPAPLVAIPVDLSTPSDLTKVKAGTRDAKDEGPLAGKSEAPKPKAVKEKVEKAPKKTASIEKTAPEPAKPAPKPEKRAEAAKPAAKPEKKAEAPKPQPKPSVPARKPEPPVE